MTNEFSSLNLHPQLMQAVSDLGFTTPTPIQSAVIPLMVAGHDVIGQAQTGTGKTAAFGLPILQSLEPNHPHVQSLIVTPTRELALQVAQAIEEYGRHQNVRVLAVYGGAAYGPQIYELKRGVDVVVDNIGQATLPDSLRAVKRGGRILIVGNTSGFAASIDTRYIFSKQISLIGRSMGPTRDFVTVLKLVFAGKLKPVIGMVLPLADIRKGHELLARGEAFGKIVLEL